MRNNPDKSYYTEVYKHELTNRKWVRLNLPIGLRKRFFQEYILQFIDKYNGKTIYARILIISSGILLSNRLAQCQGWQMRDVCYCVLPLCWKLHATCSLAVLPKNYICYAIFVQWMIIFIYYYMPSGLSAPLCYR